PDVALMKLIRINTFPCVMSKVFWSFFFINRSLGGLGMQNRLRRHGQVTGESGVAVHAVSRSLPPGGVIDIGPALECSWVTTLYGRPYPLQFRNQGAL
ncbi:hypothetical protein AAAB32_09590, partial [Lactobacillus acidophilus]|uniref:hypothetical protein n=1 Tax=Lactobacillus acidophilus TaxID=1579 RepID=UPI0030F26BE2